MSFLQPKLHLKLAQKQILTPGLVQMVSVLALNRLELRDMINQEMVENPILEEVTEELPVSEDYSNETFVKAETEKVPETPESNPFDEFDISALYQHLDSGPQESDNREREVIEKPSFDKFLSSPEGLSEHLDWQLRATVCSDKVREVTETVIGNLDEDGYLTVTLEEIAQNGGFEMDDVEEALAIVQEFDPLGVGARNLRECLTIQLKALDPQNTLAQQIVSECLPQRPIAEKDAVEEGDASLQKSFSANQPKEIARALNRPVELVKRAIDSIRKLDPRPGLRYNKTQPQIG